MGMVRRFTDRFEAGAPALESLTSGRVSITLVTSVLGAGFYPADGEAIEPYSLDDCARRGGEEPVSGRGHYGFGAVDRSGHAGRADVAAA